MSLSADGSKLAVALHQGTKQVYPESYQSVKVNIYDIGQNRSTLSLSESLNITEDSRITSMTYSPGNIYLYYSLQDNSGSSTNRTELSSGSHQVLLSSTGLVSKTKNGIMVGQGDSLKLITNADATTYTTTTLAGNTTASYNTTTASNILKYDFDFIPKNGIFAWKVGKKVYELKDHLGNVRSLIKDYRAEHPTQTGVPIAALEHYAHYYPFGMQQPGRNGNRYRFGFNGMEKDDEIYGTGNSMTAQFWQYDARLGRRWNVDPKAKPFKSNYMCFLGNPILMIDPLGDTDYINENGDRIGSDDNPGNGRVILVVDEAVIEQIANSTTFEVSNLPENTYFELPSYADRQKIKGKMSTLDKWSYHKVGGDIHEYEVLDRKTFDVVEEGTVYSNWEDGAEVESPEETPRITPFNYPDGDDGKPNKPKAPKPEKAGQWSELKKPAKYTWHSHPNGLWDKDGNRALPRDLIDFNTFSSGKSRTEYGDEPSERDFNNLSKNPFTTGMIMGTSNKTTTFYNSTRQTGSISFDTFYNYQEQGSTSPPNNN